MLFTSAQNADDIDSYYDGEESRGKRSVVLHNVNKRDNHNETANATISEGKGHNTGKWDAKY